MLILFEKKPQAAICFIALLLVADFILFGYMPSYERLKELKDRRAQQASAVAGGAARAEKLTALEDRLKKVGSRVRDFDLNVPKQGELGRFLHNVSALMNELQLSDQYIEPGERTTQAELNCIELDIRCKGGLSRIFEFYRRLQSLDRLVRIQNVKLVNDREFSGGVTMQTKAVIYYQSERRRGHK